jgi:putative nucleotidyltransferase with HDIG domain
MLAFLKRLFGRRSAPAAKGPRPTPKPSARADAPRAEGPRAPAGPGAAPAGGGSPLSGSQAQLLDMLDGKAHFQQVLTGREESILATVSHRVESGQLALPHLPATSLAAMEMAARPSANVGDVVDLISCDPVLSSELLKVSNSALYSSREKCETLREAVVRMGLRALRTMILSISMRQVLLRDKALANVAEEIWRQSHSVSMMARAIAPLLGADRERSFLIGLLHDIGKVALLETVRQEAQDSVNQVRPVLLGRVFYLMHERAGERLARSWKLPDELVSVAGCHHRFERNSEHARIAAMASLAHGLDLALALGGEHASEQTLMKRPEFEFLQLEDEKRAEIIALARETFAGSRTLALAA